MDMSNEEFIDTLNAATNDKNVKKKRRVLIVIGDGELDNKSKLASQASSSDILESSNDSINEGTAEGTTKGTAKGTAMKFDRQEIIEQVKANYGTDNNQMFAVIVTPNAGSTAKNPTIIKELCNDESHLHRFTEAEFSAGMQKALDDIASKILAGMES